MLDELFLVSGRVPKSLGALIWPPGELGAEWRRGRRARYLHPFRLYLFAAAVFFLASAAIPLEGLFIESLAQGAASASLTDLGMQSQAVSNAVRWWPSIVMVIMVPVTACMLAMSFRAMRRGLIEDMVLSLHLHAALFLLLTAGLFLRTLLSQIAPVELLELTVIAPVPIGLGYFLLAVRRYYASSWIRAGLTAIAVTAVYMAVTVFSVLRIVALSGSGTVS